MAPGFSFYWQATTKSKQGLTVLSDRFDSLEPEESQAGRSMQSISETQRLRQRAKCPMWRLQKRHPGALPESLASADSDWTPELCLDPGAEERHNWVLLAGGNPVWRVSFQLMKPYLRD